MKKFILHVMVTLFVAFSLTTMAQNLDNKGNDFIMGFLPNFSGNTLELHLTSDANTNVTINYPVNSPTFTTTVAVSPGNVTIVTIPVTAAQSWSAGTVKNNAVRAFAAEDFVCYMINRRSASTDAALALPVDVMNTEYIALTYQSTTVGSDRSQFVVVAGFDNTTVTITPKKTLGGGFAAGVPFNVTLNRGEGFLAQGIVNGPNGDLTGSFISSDRPVGVSNGNVCTNVPPNVTYCDHIFEIAQTVQSWGTTVMVANLPNRPGGSIYRILGSADNTTVSIDGSSVATINKGDFYETGVIPGSHVISADNPIFVSQYMTGDSYPGATLGDPAMGNMVPSEQYLNSYTFSTIGGNQFVQNYVTIIAETGDIGSLTLDGTAVAAGDFTPIAGTSFSSAIVALTSGTHSTFSPNGHGITVEGYNNFDSYIYPGGALFQFINQIDDLNPPVCELNISGTSGAGTVTDNGPDDTGVFFVVLESGSVNIQLDVDPFVPGDPVVTYTVSLIDPLQSGTGTITATDGAGNQCSSDIEIIISNNNPPVCSITPSGPIIVNEGDFVNFIVNASDVDNDFIELTSGTLPSGASMNPALPVSAQGNVSSSFEWTTQIGDFGNYTVEFFVEEVPDGNNKAQFVSNCSIEIIVNRTNVDITPPLCNIVSSDFGPPISIDMGVQDNGSGLATIVVTSAVNATVTIPAFTPGTNDQIIVNATQIDVNAPASAEIEVTDVDGNSSICTFPMHIFPFMTIWAVNDDGDGKLQYYTLDANNSFLNIEGNILGIAGGKDIEDLEVDANGAIYLINNIGTSKLYKICACELDGDPNTPVNAIYIGDTELAAGAGPDEIASLQFIDGVLYGIGKQTQKLYSISTTDASVTWVADLNVGSDFRTDGLTKAANGNIYLLKTIISGPSELWMFDQFPSGAISYVRDIETSKKVESLTSHPNGFLYASDFNTLFEIDPDGPYIGYLANYTVDIEGMDFFWEGEQANTPVTTLNFTPIVGEPTSVDDNTSIPTEYDLAQNFPNPFNPSTSIQYSLPEGGFVNLSIFNLLGEKIVTLVNEEKSAGTYSVTFDAKNLPSGLYIYRIEANNFTANQKMILMK